MYCVSSNIVGLTLEIPYAQKLLICTNNYHHFHYLSELI